MDLYAEIKRLRERVEALEALAQEEATSLTPEDVLNLDEVVAEVVSPAPFQSSEEQAAESARQEEEVDEAVEAALGPEVPYEGHVEPSPELPSDVVDAAVEQAARDPLADLEGEDSASV